MDGVANGTLPTLLAFGRPSFLPRVRRTVGVGTFGADHVVDPSR